MVAEVQYNFQSLGGVPSSVWAAPARWPWSEAAALTVSDTANQEVRTVLDPRFSKSQPPELVSSLPQTKAIVKDASRNEAAKKTAAKSNEERALSRSKWCAGMVCYLWFADVSRYANRPMMNPTRKRKSIDQVPQLDFSGAAGTSTRHENWLQASDRFQAFVHNILKTTQVSDSVMILALYYIYRLKTRHPQLQGQAGSEHRLFLTSLILANKFLDDYTYTNKTWSEVSRTPLKEITSMELQLLGGIGTNAYISADQYKKWCKSLVFLQQQRKKDILLLQRMKSPPITPFSVAAASPPSTLPPTSDGPFAAPLRPRLAVSPVHTPNLAMQPPHKRHKSWQGSGTMTQDWINAQLMPLSAPSPPESASGTPEQASAMPRVPSVLTPALPLPTWSSPAWPGMGANTDMAPELFSMTTSYMNRPFGEAELFRPLQSSFPLLSEAACSVQSPFVPPQQMQLGYYRLAAGYPYGISTMMYMNGSNDASTWTGHPFVTRPPLGQPQVTSPGGNGMSVPGLVLSSPHGSSPGFMSPQDALYTAGFADIGMMDSMVTTPTPSAASSSPSGWKNSGYTFTPSM